MGTFLGLVALGLIGGVCYLVPKWYGSEGHRRAVVRNSLWYFERVPEAQLTERDKYMMSALRAEIDSWCGKPYDPWGPAQPAQSV